MNHIEESVTPGCITRPGVKFEIRKTIPTDIGTEENGFGCSCSEERNSKMLDLKFLRENPEVVKQNIQKKFQDRKLPLVDEVIELDAQARATQQEADELRAERNKISKQIGALMAQGKKEEAEETKKLVTEKSEYLAQLEVKESELNEKILKIMMTIPNIIDPSVPIGKDDSENVEIQKYGEPVVPDFEVPYHTDIMERLNGIDLDSARKVAGNGFYYLM